MTRISALRALSLKPLENGHVMGSVRLFATGPYKPVFSRLEVPRAFIYFFYIKKRGHMIKCLLTELGRAVRENIWLSVICTDLAALVPYGITLSQIFSHMAHST